MVREVEWLAFLGSQGGWLNRDVGIAGVLEVGSL